MVLANASIWKLLEPLKIPTESESHIICIEIHGSYISLHDQLFSHKKPIFEFDSFLYIYSKNT